MVLYPNKLPESERVCSGICNRCKAWRKKIPERSEDDFFPANQPDRAALHSQWQRAIFAVRNEIMVENYIANL